MNGEGEIEFREGTNLIPLLTESRVNVPEEMKKGEYQIGEKGKAVVLTVPRAEDKPHGVLVLVPGKEREVRVGWIREEKKEGGELKPVVDTANFTLSFGKALVIGRNPADREARKKIKSLLGGKMRVEEMKIEGGPMTSRAHIVVRLTGEGGLKVVNVGKNPVGVVEKNTAQWMGKQLFKASLT